MLRDTADARDALAAIAAGFAQPTILLVDDPHAELAHAALAAGASAVLARQSDARELRATIGAVALGLLVVDAAARDAFARRTLHAAAPARDTLTERELDVLRLLASGASNRRIAQRLGIAENTVKAHVAAVLAKLDAATRTQAVTNALRAGVLML